MTRTDLLSHASMRRLPPTASGPARGERSAEPWSRYAAAADAVVGLPVCYRSKRADQVFNPMNYSQDVDSAITFDMSPLWSEAVWPDTMPTDAPPPDCRSVMADTGMESAAGPAFSKAVGPVPGAAPMGRC